MDKISKLVRAARTSANMSQAALAKAIDATQSTISHIESGRNTESRLINKIAAVLKIPPEKLGLKSDNDDSESVMVPSLSVKACCGQGVQIDHVYIEGGFTFPKKWLISMGFNKKSLEVVSSYGDSMYPTIKDGEILLVDKDETRLTAGQNNIYLIIFDNEVMVKRIEKVIGKNIIRLTSDNPNKATYPDIELDYDDIANQLNDTFYILGKIIWRGGSL